MEHPSRPKDIHHRINRRNSKNHTREFPIKVDKKKHQFFHALFGSKNVYEIAKELNEKWIDPNYEIIVIKRSQI